MPQGALVNLLRDRPSQEAALVRRHFRRLNTLASQGFDRALSAQQLQELLASRAQLRNHLASWLQKR